MGGLVKSIFGGTDRSAQRAQVTANADNRALFQNLSTQAQDQAKALYGASDQNRNITTQQILQLLGGTIPQQLSALQHGNVGAQQQLLAGLPMVQAAIMGQPVNMGALQPTRINYNTDFARQAPPQYVTTQQALARPTQQPTQPDLSALLGGSYSDV
jgi:hypothetical protein